MRWALWVPLALFAVFVALVVAGLYWPKDTNVASAMVGKPIPAFDLPPSVAGRPGLSSANLADGRPKLLNVFASWCPPCRVEAPQLDRLARSGVEIVGVAIRDRPEDTAAFLAAYGNPFTRIGRDDLSKLQVSIGSSGVPETFVVDGKGVIRHQLIGEVRPEHVPMLLAKLGEAAR
ncbi:MAG: DsbE family thiol:disulfide interchange protein [Novosphingobium sp.]